MKIKNFIFIIFHLFDLSFTLIPIWDIKYTSIVWTPSEGSSKVITIYEQSAYYLHAILTKNITKTNSQIKDQNYIKMLDSEINNKTDWTDIDQSYFVNKVGHFVCPTGKNFLNQYNKENLFEMIPTDFTEVDDWDLICFYIDITNEGGENWKWIFQGFSTNATSKIYGKQLNGNGNWIVNEIATKGLFDFIWGTELVEPQKYNFYALVLRSKGIHLNNYHPQIYGGGWNRGDYKGSILIDYTSNIMQAYFDQDTKVFYWMASNGTTDEFRSGYSTEALDLKVDKLNWGTKNNTDSPFIFLNDVNIIKLKLLRNTRFIYYELSDKKDSNIIYKGIIDIEINQIILNTNENFKKFEPLTNYSIFAIKDNKAYEICFIKDGEKCVKKCQSNTTFVLNNIDGNHCEKTCQKFRFLSNNVCSDYCNNTFYDYIPGSDNIKMCGLCKDLNPSKPYKIINKEGCLEKKPNNTYIYNEKYYLLDNCSTNCKKCSNRGKCDECEDGYSMINGKCGKCHKNCQICSKFNGNDTNQYCTKCKENLYFLSENRQGNCIEYCPNGTYINTDICSKCHKNCETCQEGPKEDDERCKTCKDKKYLIDADDFGSNCTQECPNGTIITNKSDIFYCTKPGNPERNNEKEKEKEKDKLISYIYIISIGVCLLILTICIYKNICGNKKKDNEMITQIHTELQENH